MADQTRAAGDSVLADRDANKSMMDQQQAQQEAGNEKDVKSMEYHRQIFQSKMAENTSAKYVSPSDNIMSPCSAKISAIRNKSAAKVKPKSLFAQASAKKLEGDKPPGDNPFAPSSSSDNPFGPQSS
ncbi:hypothetical protein CDD82_1338 [Ophiocordyceps australis]|uniref:Spo12-like protein n=1 Tax=Ophiocordyceps australis TaxID=1399860 RepID=A0A2C5ZVB7_9HYPO|nr:hypothetical protein CDD82_1338 [Ophiocordyceps australis]